MRETICPICNGYCDQYVFDINGDIVGCDRCITIRGSLEYEAEQDELKADYYRETFMSER